MSDATFSFDDVMPRLSPQAQLEVSNAVLAIQLEQRTAELEQALARIAELENP